MGRPINDQYPYLPASEYASGNRFVDYPRSAEFRLRNIARIDEGHPPGLGGLPMHLHAIFSDVVSGTNVHSLGPAVSCHGRPYGLARAQFLAPPRAHCRNNLLEPGISQSCPYGHPRASAPATKYAVMVSTPEELRSELANAYSIAFSGRKGPVLVDVPMSCDRTEKSRARSRGTQTTTAPIQASVRA